MFSSSQLYQLVLYWLRMCVVWDAATKTCKCVPDYPTEASCVRTLLCLQGYHPVVGGCSCWVEDFLLIRCSSVGSFHIYLYLCERRGSRRSSGWMSEESLWQRLSPSGMWNLLRCVRLYLHIFIVGSSHKNLYLCEGRGSRPSSRMPEESLWHRLPPSRKLILSTLYVFSILIRII